MSQLETTLQLVGDPTQRLTAAHRASLALVGLGVVALIVAACGAGPYAPDLFLWSGFGLTTLGGLLYIKAEYGRTLPGIRNDGLWFKSSTARGAIGWILAIVFTGFYILLYWNWSWHLLDNLVRVCDPLSKWMRGGIPADEWFLYGTVYTLAILVMGVRMIARHRHSRYQIIRTISVMSAQTLLAWLLPAILKAIRQPEFYFSYFWPLKADYFFPGTVHDMEAAGGLPMFMIRWAIVLAFVGVPVLTYFFGKRWYCSWVCGCGGLAETAGDQWRQLSDKSLSAWKFERWSIHIVLLAIIGLTTVLWVVAASGTQSAFADGYKYWYGLLVGSIWSGVIGVGFYPLMGTRVWCRFGCPQAAILGLLQKFFSRFRITTNGGQCISCGNCSTYCEMGIDVRWYAQRGQNIVRASCVGCGMCASVCPRGVLKLENGPVSGRTPGPGFVAVESITGIPYRD